MSGPSGTSLDPDASPPIHESPPPPSPAPAAAASPTSSSSSGRRRRDAAPPRVTAVIVSWNRHDLVLGAVRSLRQSDYPGDRLEIIVVDNGSTDGTPEALAREPDVQLVALDYNPGPSAARNIAIARATGDYILLLDSDARLAARGLRRAIERMEADPAIAIAGLRVINGYSGDVDQWIYAEPYETHGRRTFETYSFSAAGAILRAAAVRAAGGFWEQLRIYNEEVDLSIRVIRGGGRVVYLPAATVFHMRSPGSAASHRGSGTYFRLQIRNWIWIFHRHYRFRQRCELIALYCAVYLVKAVANWRMLQVLRGMAEGLAGYRIARLHAEKLTGDQARHLQSLNRRSHVRLWGEGIARPLKRRRRARDGGEGFDDADALATS